jgi:hypothetical protein
MGPSHAKASHPLLQFEMIKLLALLCLLTSRSQCNVASKTVAFFSSFVCWRNGNIADKCKEMIKHNVLV